MPELPEVEVVRRGLAHHVVDRTIAHVDVAHPRAVRRHLEGGDDFAARLVGRTITAARRRGKYLWLELDGDRSGHDAVQPDRTRPDRANAALGTSDLPNAAFAPSVPPAEGCDRSGHDAAAPHRILATRCSRTSG